MLSLVASSDAAKIGLPTRASWRSSLVEMNDGRLSRGQLYLINKQSELGFIFPDNNGIVVPDHRCCRSLASFKVASSPV